jgi:glutaredoxin
VARAETSANRGVVTLYARPDCHLCDQARAQLEQLQAEGLAFELQEVDIDSDDRLLARYLERIPVVTLGGEIVSELWLDPGSLRARLDTVSG